MYVWSQSYQKHFLKAAAEEMNYVCNKLKLITTPILIWQPSFNEGEGEIDLRRWEETPKVVWGPQDAQVFFGQKQCQSKVWGAGLEEVVTLEEGQPEVAPFSKPKVYPLIGEDWYEQHMIIKHKIQNRGKILIYTLSVLLYIV